MLAHLDSILGQLLRQAAYAGGTALTKCFDFPLPTYRLSNCFHVHLQLSWDIEFDSGLISFFRLCQN